jgi:hypothetical protein
MVRNAKNRPTDEQGVAEQRPAAAACQSLEHAISWVKYGSGPALMVCTEDVVQLVDRPSSDSFTRLPSPAVLLLTKPPVQPSARLVVARTSSACRTQQRR